jgi:UDP:flavonoid glycosyltransferase YjiC (YdhE family)
MSRILFTTMPFAGHLRPALPIAQALIEAGHEVAWYSGAQYAHLVRRIGARLFLMSPEVDREDTTVEADRGGAKPGLRTLKRDIIDIFINPVPAWIEEIDVVLDEFRPDVIVAEHGFMAGPIAGERRGIPSIVFNVSPLGISSVDTAPFGMGLLPSSSSLGRLRNRTLNWAIRNVIFAECQRAAGQMRARLGLPTLASYFMDWGVDIADRYLVPSVPAFEYPRSDLPEQVEFVGPFLPAGVDDWTPPAWWDDVLAAKAAGRPVVLVTQGTIATDPANLVLPSVEALGGGDALVIATTSGHSPDDVVPADDRPATSRIASAARAAPR